MGTPHKHAANDITLRFQYRTTCDPSWKDCSSLVGPAWHPDHEYRVKE